MTHAQDARATGGARSVATSYQFGGARSVVTTEVTTEREPPEID
ncbi:MAG: hypothetical protein NZ741_12815 [Armatimonadetes bacterium]|nr:hypothetical protein [Armatimonadota bacterium]